MTIPIVREPICQNCAWYAPPEDGEGLGKCEVVTDSAYSSMILVSEDEEAELLVQPHHTCGEFVEFTEEDE